MYARNTYNELCMCAHMSGAALETASMLSEVICRQLQLMLLLTHDKLVTAAGFQVSNVTTAEQLAESCKVLLIGPSQGHANWLHRREAQ